MFKRIRFQLDLLINFLTKSLAPCSRFIFKPFDKSSNKVFFPFSFYRFIPSREEIYSVNARHSEDRAESSGFLRLAALYRRCLRYSSFYRPDVQPATPKGEQFRADAKAPFPANAITPDSQAITIASLYSRNCRSERGNWLRKRGEGIFEISEEMSLPRVECWS